MFHHELYCCFVWYSSEPYSVREARIHIRRLRDLLSTSLYQSGFTATDNMSLSLYSTVAGIDPEGKDIALKSSALFLRCSLVIMYLID